ncbi:MAG: VOC family protein [Lautropia sp.]|nr:VOC family protein [Lautropia sp.]
MTIRRLLANISSERLQESRDFYVDLFGLVVAHETDWYVKLVSPADPDLELGIIQRNHPLLPAAWRGAPAGMYLGFAVDNVDEFHARAVVRGLTIVQPPRDEPHGKRRFLTQDPDGILVEISSPVRQHVLPEEPSPASIAQEMARRVPRMARSRQALASRRTIDQVLRGMRPRLASALG